MGSAASSPPGHRRVSVPRQLCKKDLVPGGGAPREAGGRRDPAGLGRVGASAQERRSLRLRSLLTYGLVWTSSAAGVAPARPSLSHSVAFSVLSVSVFTSERIRVGTDLYSNAHFVICTIPLVAILRDTCWEDL